ncbi:MAG: tRNA pseudouridine(13) synthase TruD [Candidatus Diapherotrites archaeon]|nr:tRNA pseudouridine(13) synthase TruD [Candidatus Diapherotrites archaeon]
MKFIKSPENFKVKEIMFPELNETGIFNYYLMQQKGLGSSKAIKLLEKENNARIFSSGLKDAKALTEQWICSEKKLKSKEKEIALEFKGKSSKRIFIGMHSANEFKVKLNEVTEKEKKFISNELNKIFFPNYFDEQRFRKSTLETGKALIERNWEKAVKTALTLETDFESNKSKEIKKLIRENWKKWSKLCDSVELPEVKRNIFCFLEEENDFKNAVLMLERKVISMACKASQSNEFNEKLKTEIMKQERKQKLIEIDSMQFPVLFKHKALKRKITVQNVFPEKRILERKTFFKPEQIKAKFNENNCLLEFNLKKGEYATIVIKCIQELVKE